MGNAKTELRHLCKTENYIPFYNTISEHRGKILLSNELQSTVRDQKYLNNCNNIPDTMYSL